MGHGCFPKLWRARVHQLSLEYYYRKNNPWKNIENIWRWTIGDVTAVVVDGDMYVTKQSTWLPRTT